MTDPDENEPYQVKATGGAFQILDEGGEVILACGDSANASQYAALLSQAFRRGYKAGYRKGRSVKG